MYLTITKYWITDNNKKVYRVVSISCSLCLCVLVFDTGSSLVWIIPWNFGLVKWGWVWDLNILIVGDVYRDNPGITRILLSIEGACRGGFETCHYGDVQLVLFPVLLPHYPPSFFSRPLCHSALDAESRVLSVA